MKIAIGDWTMVNPKKLPLEIVIGDRTPATKIKGTIGYQTPVSIKPWWKVCSTCQPNSHSSKFSLDGSSYPWLMIDFGWTRYVSGINLTLAKDIIAKTSDIEVRFGFERPRWGCFVSSERVFCVLIVLRNIKKINLSSKWISKLLIATPQTLRVIKELNLFF